MTPAFLLGRYVATDRRLAYLDPRTKLAFCLALLLGAAWVFDGTTFVLLLLLASSGYHAFGLRLRMLAEDVWGFRVFVALTFAMHVLLYAAGTSGTFPFLTLSAEGIARAGMFSLRLTVFLSSASLLSHTISPIELVDALERLSSPLKKLGLPVSGLTMTTGIALRFIPVLFDEALMLKRAMLARGLSFSGSMVGRAKTVGTLLLPLLANTMRRSDELALAMKARGFVPGAPRTSYVTLRFGLLDGAVMVLSVVAVVASVYAGRSI